MEYCHELCSGFKTMNVLTALERELAKQIRNLVEADYVYLEYEAGIDYSLHFI